MSLLEILASVPGAAGRPATRSAAHSGNMGDIVYALPTLQALGIDRLVLNLVADPGIGGRQLTRGAAEFLLPLLTAQPGLAEVAVARARLRLAVGILKDGRGPEIARGLPLDEVPAELAGVDYVLDRFRLQPVDRISIVQAHARALGARIDERRPFLVLPEPVAPDADIVLSLTPRYRHLPAEHFARLLRGIGRVLLVGSAAEREAFAGVPGEFVAATDALHLARIVAGCRLFIGVPSLPLAIAEGLKHPRLADVPDWPANTVPTGPGGWLLPAGIDDGRRMIEALLDDPHGVPGPARAALPPRRVAVRDLPLEARLSDPADDRVIARLTCAFSREPVDYALDLPAVPAGGQLDLGFILGCWIEVTAVHLESRRGLVAWRLDESEGTLPGSSLLLVERDGRRLLTGRQSYERLRFALPGPARAAIADGGGRIRFTLRCLRGADAAWELSFGFGDRGRTIEHLKQVLADTEIRHKDAYAQLQTTTGAHIAHLEEHIANLDEQLGTTRHHLAEETRQLGHTTSRLNHISARLAQSEVARANAEVQVHQLATDLDALRASTSWKVTQPLRAVVHGLRDAKQQIRRRPAQALPPEPPPPPPANEAGAPPPVDDTGAAPPPTATAAPEAVHDDSFDWTDRDVLAIELAKRARQRIERLTPEAPKLLDFTAGELDRQARRLSFPDVAEPAASVIVPVYDGLKYTLECLASLAQEPAGASFEVIVIDDASSDGTAEAVARIPGLVYLRNEQNLGFLRSCNRAAAKARGRVVVYLNNDAQVTANWLKPLIDAFAADPAVAAAGPKVLFPNGRLQEAGCAINSDLSVTMVGLFDDPALPRYDLPREVDYCSGACLAVDADRLRAVGLFDERLAPAYYEDMDLCLALRARGGRIVYNPRSVVYHHLSVSSDKVSKGWKMSRILANRQKVAEKWQPTVDGFNDVKLIAFYLPQYHPIPENDRWWGQGFTEWTNVSKARPNFVGHYQPRLPGELGFYDLRVEEVMARQAELAKTYGIHGFCFYYYWFAGQRLLEMPVERLLAKGVPDIPYCLCWANENWTRRWDGNDREILMGQRHDDADDAAVIRDLMRHFRHPNYIRVDGRPFLAVYRPSLFPDMRRTVQTWRRLCREEGIGEIYLTLVESFEADGGRIDPRTLDMDASVEFPAHTPLTEIAPPGPVLRPEFRGHVRDYRELVFKTAAQALPAWTRFRGVLPGWDNTARRQNDGYMLTNASPGAYQAWLEDVLQQTREQNFGDERMVFVNAWNEWGEGAYLEPDRRYGRSYLEATRNAREPWVFQPLPKPGEDPPPPAQGLPEICLVGHPFAPIGRGEDIRAALRAFKAVGIEPTVRDVYALNPRDPDQAVLVEPHLTERLSPDINIFFINGDEVAPILAHLKDHRPPGAYDIVYPAWELPRYPAEWAEALARFPETWAQSRFVLDSLTKAGLATVVHMTQPSEPLIPRFLGRRQLKLPDSAFLFLFAFDFSSYVDRKNPWAVLKAFEGFLARHPQADVRLVIKTNGSHTRPDDHKRFRAAFERFRDRVVIIDRTLSDPEMKNLIRAADCFVSLHRAEGFGRGPAEAMFYGRPVIATGYSGNMDFMTPETACLVDYSLVPVPEDAYPHWQDQVWADPDVDSATRWMCKVYEDRAFATELGRRAARVMRTQFASRAAGLRFAERIKAIAADRVRMPAAAK